jgi:hypothetical protein
MAHICLRYLLMEDLEDDNSRSNSNIRNLLEYSAVYRWGCENTSRVSRWGPGASFSSIK